MKVLVLNSGSSSLKYQLIDSENEEVLAKGIAERIGLSEGKLRHSVNGRNDIEITKEMVDHEAAMDLVFAMLTDPEVGAVSGIEEISAVGHRVVHGGEQFREPTMVTEEILTEIDKVSELAPLHNPPNLAGIRACRRLMPGVPQVAVFDTAFHATMPKHAYIYALPYELYEERRVRRYGFHGTSHKYVSGRATRLLQAEGYDPERLKVITCHLGNGCSMTAIVGGKVVDTSMGMTPAEGLVMGTRSGDVDPAILLYLERNLNWTAEDVDDLINKKSGLLGVSGYSSDMRDIEDGVAAGNERATLALDIFCYRVRKYMGAYAAAMDGLDAVVLTGGIGENCPNVRARICRGLGFLGLELDPEENQIRSSEDRDISRRESRARILIIPTNEERMIARETSQLVGHRVTG
jgi:acetate kinase